MPCCAFTSTRKPTRASRSVARHFAPYAGEQVFVEMVHPVEERRRFKGRMVAAGDDMIEVEVDGRLHRLPIAGIRKAHLAPDY